MAFLVFFFVSFVFFVPFVMSPFARAADQGTPMDREQKITIVAMGDSTTAGTPAWKSRVELPPSGGGDETSQYAYWLIKAHPEWNVLNMGVNGERSDQIRGRFERDVIDQHPRVVILIAGVNDVYQGRDIQHVKEQLASMYERAKRSGIPVIAGSVIPYNTATAEQNKKMHAINAWIRERADEDANLFFVDTRAAAADRRNPDVLLDSPDGLHPSPAGYRRMAEAIEPVLQRLLNKK